jgi:hypothetical protein
MDLSKYKYFYVNGSSYCEGGGLEEPEIRDDSVIQIGRASCRERVSHQV